MVLTVCQQNLLGDYVSLNVFKFEIKTIMTSHVKLQTEYREEPNFSLFFIFGLTILV